MCLRKSTANTKRNDLFRFDSYVEMTAGDETSTMSTRSHVHYTSSPQSVIVIFLEGRPDREPKDSTFLTTSIPSFTLPKTTCLPSSLNEQRGNVLFIPTARQSMVHPSGLESWLFVWWCLCFNYSAILDYLLLVGQSITKIKFYSQQQHCKNNWSAQIIISKKECIL